VTTLTDRPRASDFVKWEADQRYTRVAGTITNKSGQAMEAGDLKPGYPLNLNGTTWETLDDASEASADGFFVDGRVSPALAIDAATTLEYQILVRGPAIVNLDAVPAPAEGGAYNLADLKTRMLALNPPIIVLREPTAETTQTT
jgi:hypothetical protein